VAIVAAAGWAAWRHEITEVKITAAAEPVSLVVPPGATAETVGRELFARGLVVHPAVFRLLARSRGLGAQIKAGEHALRGPLSLEGLLDELVRGAAVRRGLTVPEGLTIQEVAGLARGEGLDERAFLAAAADGSLVRDLDPLAEDLEGYLFPDTYDLPPGPEPEKALVLRMARRFREVVAPLAPRARDQGFTIRELVTLASIVEEETAQAAERPQIAAVFLNRLRRGMPLQTDPTVIYAMRQAGRWNGNIRKQDLAIDSPYNTYRHPGLPPGPIAAPGREALLAVLEPAESRALYFVSRNDGTHHFSETLVEHNRAVNRYQRRRSQG
jgi:UPF0755 protein